MPSEHTGGAKHTPGPWSLTENEDDELEITATSRDGKVEIAVLSGGSVQRANARLIAAAPTVDAAARAFLDSYDRAENAVTLATRIKALRAALALTAGEN